MIVKDVCQKNDVPLLTLRESKAGLVEIARDEGNFRMALFNQYADLRQIEHRRFDAIDRGNQVGRV